MTVVTPVVGDPMDWVMLLGIVLIVAGCALLLSAVFGASRNARRSRRRRERWRELNRAGRTDLRPQIRPSALLARTVPLEQVPVRPARGPAGNPAAPATPLRTPRPPSPARFAADSRPGDAPAARRVPLSEIVTRENPEVREFGPYRAW